MLKRLIIALSMFVFMLCGCEKQTVKPILNNISFTAEIVYGDYEFIGNTEISDNDVKFIVTKPQEIKDPTFNIAENKINSEYKGLSLETDINSSQQGAVVKILYDVLNDIVAKQICAEISEENCIINGKTDSYEYEFIFSPSGLPIELNIDDTELKIQFKNVTVI